MQENKEIRSEKKYGFSAFLPLIIFLVLYIGCGLVFTALGTEDAFKQIPRQVCLIIGLAVALIMNRGVKLDKKIDIFAENAGASGVMYMVLIYLLAGGFQGAAKAMGGVDSVVNMGLTFIPVSLLVPGVFLISCFISTAIGTSMGTIAAMAPIAIGVAQGAGLNLAMVCAAVLGGSYFGDNLSIISDTTISATRGVGAEMKDKFRMNFLIALPAAIVSMIIYGIMGGAGSAIEGDLTFHVIRILPYIVVLVLALAGFNVAGVLFVGIAMTFVIGMPTGAAGFFDLTKAIGSGMDDMMGISIVAIFVSGLIGLIKYYGGIDWLINAITSRINSRRGAEYSIGLLSGLLSISLVNNTVAIIISAPIAKEIGFKYHIAPKRLASLLDIFACAFLTVCPHDGGMLIVTGLAGVSPVDVFKFCFYPFLLLLATIITIHFGLLRTPEEKAAMAAEKASANS